MLCNEFRDLMFERLSGELDAQQDAACAQHEQSCVICRRIEPMVAAVASGGGVRAHKLDAERHLDFAAKHNIMGVPTLLLFRDGELIDRRSGFSTASALREWIGASGATAA